MRQAIVLSARGLGTSSPNPPVGCVILDRHGEPAGTGYHQRKGEPHAEGHAVAAAGDKAKGGTAVVTLEPCNHLGRTPPCHQALIDAGVTRVVIALIDPTSRAEGGAAKLRAAGVDVEVGVLADEARLVLGPWLDALAFQRPILTATPDDDQIRGLRVSQDVVLSAEGRVEEGVPGGHGAGVLDLPPAPLTGDPADVLKVLYAGGVRSVLLIAPVNRIHEFAYAKCLDKIVTTSDFSIPSGFGLTSIDKTGAEIIMRTFARQD